MIAPKKSLLFFYVIHLSEITLTENSLNFSKKNFVKYNYKKIIIHYFFKRDREHLKDNRLGSLFTNSYFI
jgi:hypothetical protein